MPQLEKHVVCMGTLRAELGSKEQVASGELRQIPEDTPLEPELRKSHWSLQSVRILEDEESEPEWQAEQRDAPAALRKLRNSFTGDLHPVLPSRTRSGGQGGENKNVDGGEAASNEEDLGSAPLHPVVLERIRRSALVFDVQLGEE